MGLLKTITDAAWLSSGSATAGNTGFDALGTAQFETDEDGDKYITTAATNTILTARIDPAANVFAASETRYHAEWVVYLEFTGASNANTIGTVGTNGVIDYFGAGPRGYAQLAALNSDIATGVYFTFGVGAGAAVGAAISGLGSAPIGVNTKVTIGTFADRTAGVAGVLINGVRAGGWTATPVAAWDSTVTLTLPPIVGARWRIYASTARPCRSYTGSDHDFTPLHSENASTTDALRMSLAHIATDGLHGLYWTYAGNCALTDYETSGANPQRKRLIGGSGGVVATSKIDVGALPFNEEGDCSFDTTIYVPSAGTCSIVLRNAENTADAVKLQVASGQLQNAAGVQLTASDGTAITIATNKRYALKINLSADGSASWTLHNFSDDPAARTMWSNEIPGGYRSPGIGKIILTASQNVEIDRVDVSYWSYNGITDSLFVAYAPTTTPALPVTANNFGLGFPYSDASTAIPGINWPGKQYGQPRSSFLFSCARSGTTRAAWDQYVRPYMTYTKAMRIMAIDGAVTNDISGGVSADTIMLYVAADYEWCRTHNSQLILMPQFHTPMGLSLSLSTFAKQIQRERFNRLQYAYVQSKAGDRRLFYCDFPRGYFGVMDSTDGAHNTSGTTGKHTRAIIGSMQTAEQATDQMQLGYADERRGIKL